MMQRQSWMVMVVVLAVVVASGSVVVGQEEEDDEEVQQSISGCNAKLTCSDCYTTQGCVFCGATDLITNATVFRCVSQQNIPEVWADLCPSEDRYMTVNKLTIADRGDTGGSNKRLKPSKMDLYIGKNQSYNVTISVEIIDLPQLELYILMDLSRSMWDDKEKLYNLTQELIAELQSMNSLEEPKIGFGAFVDKPVLPFISLAPEGYANKPTCKNVTCDEPWGFRNYKHLTVDVDDVKTAIKSAPVAVNLDLPEGGFDGVMQAIVCDEEIGWEAGTEKMLVYLSDAQPHLAGDGKLAGIMHPNDMECHMDETPGKDYSHEYSHSKIMDYPSVGQIAQKAEEHGISIIFLATERILPLYARISQMILGSSYAAITTDSDNIVDLIRNEYAKIQQKVSLKHHSSSDAMSLRYFSKCTGEVLQETATCSNLKNKQSVTFTIEVTMKDCDLSQAGDNQLIKIFSFGDEANPVEITIHPLCKCGCEERDHQDFDEDSSDCSFQGDLMCGVCKCYTEYGGKTCSCDKNEIEAENAGCRPDNSTMVECYERGFCECNECICEQGYSGDHCQCDNTNCKRGNGGKVCSGHGVCECSVCKCDRGWTGEACDCSTETDNCLNPGSGEVCSLHGSCECNQCKCNNTMYSYTGNWCETCKDCPKRCDELGPCVLCRHSAQEDSEAAHCEPDCSQFLPLQVTFLDHLDEPSEGDVLCSKYDSEDCRVSFVYGPGDNGTLHLQVLKKKECPIPPPILPIVLGIIGAIVVLGVIALLAWKCYAIRQDRLEYERFLMEQATAKWSDNTNPMYKPATTTTQNPLFGLKED